MHYISRAVLVLGLAASAGVAGAGGVMGAAKTAGSFQVRVALAPSVIPYDSSAILGAMTTPGAMCSAKVTYANGKVPASFAHYVKKQFKAPANGVVRWVWHEKSLNKKGKAAVTCTFKGKTVTAGATFKITTTNG